VSAKFIKQNAPKTGEWHHTSKFYNPVDYYDHEEVKHWLDSEDGKKSLSDFKNQESANKESPSQVMDGAHIKYLEWGGTRNHPTASEREEHNVHIEQKPGQSMVTITRPDGSNFKKKLDTKGFEIKDKTGKHFYADYVFKNESVAGKGRGNWGHAGIKGQIGGSAPAIANSIPFHNLFSKKKLINDGDASVAAAPMTGGSSRLAAISSKPFIKKFATRK